MVNITIALHLKLTFPLDIEKILDPVIIRLAFVLVTLHNGVGLLVYLLLALLMPEEKLPEAV